MSDSDFKRDDAGRFGKGNPGGPGRPKGSTGFSIKSALDRAIAESIREEDGRSILDALARTAIKAAAEGDFRFWKELIDRLDGPIKQQIEQDSTVFIERINRQANHDESETDDDGGIPTN